MAVVLPVLTAAERAVVELELRLGATLLDELRLGATLLDELRLGATLPDELRLGAVAVVLRLWLTEDELRLGDELLLRLAELFEYELLLEVLLPEYELRLLPL